MNVIGEVSGKTAVIIDDEIDTAGSLMEAVGALAGGGRTRDLLLATHGVFSGAALERINASAITEVMVTDTIPLPGRASRRQGHDPVGGAALRRGDPAASTAARAWAPSSRPRSTWSRR